MQNEIIVEVCANSLASCIAAQEGGAKRVELCDNIIEGGTTPSIGSIQVARQNLDIALNVIIRPRGGDFFYNAQEIEIMKRDIIACKDAGVDGVVFGILNSDGCIDKVKTEELIYVARPLRITFHRAFDMTPEPFGALEELIELGIDRILTSGQQNKAFEGIDLIKKLNEKAAGRIIIMPGSGINEKNIKEIKETCGISECHLSGRSVYPGNMVYRKAGISMGGNPDISEYDQLVTDPEKIKAVIQACNS